ncbi:MULTISPECIES: riboflavin synthase [Clostridiaceae]|uniref:riboflavin synthase n=1 Tax=Clostridiaceae TaxID=31979 RepID=UPI0005564891|nr:MULTISPECIES: riboflavin synthase [Clostridiaceae]
MFTGIIEEIGQVENIKKGEKSASIRIKSKRILGDVKIGDSISTNGVCLTVTEFNKESFSVDVMPETIRRTNLKYLNNGTKVNLERALKVGDRFGGHMVSGHIDGTGVIKEFVSEDNALWISIGASKEILKYVITKGSVALDGISLTVAYVDEDIFKVSIIPHTKEQTTLSNKKVGEKINIECDLVGKYMEKFMNFNKVVDKKRDISLDFLKENGFY